MSETRSSMREMPFSEYWPKAICVDESHAYFATDIGLFMSDK